MNKVAVTLIIIAAAVLAGGYYYVNSRPAPAPPPERNEATLRSTQSGDVVGFTDSSGARAWLGVPFARPPVGQLRWKAPQPPSPSAGTIEALAFGPPCAQLASPLIPSAEGDASTGVVGEEDCLYLNIWSPPNARDLPVMLWIHGGGNSIGSGGDVVGGALATSRSLVVVSVNYRLGPFGWFSHPALLSGNPADDSGNYGTLDMIRALQWVRDNIAVFGGNPGNLTVFGESAGARNTLDLMASPLAKGLFHRAIVQSGGYGPVPMPVAQGYLDEGGHPFSGREVVNAMLVADGSAADAAAARVLQADWGVGQLAEHLRRKAPQEFFAVLEEVGFGMVNLPTNFADGHVLPVGSASEVFSVAENHNQVPVILGTNRDEPSLFMAQNPDYVDDLFGLFRWLKDEAHYRRQVHYGARAWKARGVDELAMLMVASGNPRVFAYRWDWDEEPAVLGFDLGVALGAAHGLEIPFIFGNFADAFGAGYLYPHDDNQRRLSESMTSYWAEFAYQGDPGQGRDGREAAWLSWGQDGKTSILLDTPGDGGIRMDDQTVTYAAVKAELLADPSFADLRERCETYVRVLRRSDLFDADEYADMGCAAYPPESVNWF